MTLILEQSDAYILARRLSGLTIDDLTPSPLVSVMLKATEGAMGTAILTEMLGKANVLDQIFAIDPNTSPVVVNQKAARPWKHYTRKQMRDMPPLTYLIPGEILENGLNIIFGESGSGKSFLAVDYAMKLARKDETVVYIPTEGEAGYNNRCTAWERHHGWSADENPHFIIGGVSLYDKQLSEWLLEDLRELKPKMVVVDTLAMAMIGADENSGRDMGAVIDNCRRMIRELNTAVVLVHHVSKARNIERGSGALRGHSESMIRLTLEDDVIIVECSKSKDSSPFVTRYMRLINVADSMVMVESSKTVRSAGDRLSQPQMKILETLSWLADDTQGATQREIVEAADLKIGAVGRALRVLSKLGHVAEPAVYGMGYTLTESGRELLTGNDSVDSDDSGDS